MESEKQAEPIKIETPATEKILEHHFINSHKNAEKTHILLEHHLANNEKNAKISHSLAENLVELQGRILSELQRPIEKETPLDLKPVLDKLDELKPAGEVKISNFPDSENLSNVLSEILGELKKPLEIVAVLTFTNGKDSN